ncbi:hypothetical protein G9A89_006838 [Geosiphon pyriformis]|nr:hypothetical protein G9A89_006838 [Geosiphon pyriformis]
MSAFAFIRVANAICKSPVFSSCLNITQATLNACGRTDFTCLCNGRKSVVDCYAQCPEDQSVQDKVPALTADRDDACARAPVITQTYTPSSTSASSPTSTKSNASTDSASNSKNTNPPIQNNAPNQFNQFGKILFSIPLVAAGLLGFKFAIAI